MRILDRQFTKSGWNHTQVCRAGNFAIYRREKGGPDHFEVIRIKSHNGFGLPNGNVTTPAEYYPSENAWGRDGFTFNTLAEADTKFAALVHEASRPKVQK